MIHSDPQTTTRHWAVGKPVPAFGMVALILVCAVGCLSWLLFQAIVLPTVSFAFMMAICLRGFVQSYPHDSLGMCNVVTMTRAALVAILAGAIFTTVNPWLVFMIATIAFALDGVDGWFARRSGLSSAFGARFDMEIDSLLAAVLALVLLVGGIVGPAILVLGFTRYVFVVAGLVWPALQGDLPESMRRKIICVVQIAALIILVFPLTPDWAIAPASVGAAIAVLYSFAIDARFLFGQRA